MAQSVVLNGHTVMYDPDVERGIYHLTRELGMEERKVYFDEAYNKGYALFQDRMGYHYKLVHHNGEYQLVKP